MSPLTESVPTTSPAPDTATRILDAAEALFTERGFAATSVRAIARHAGVNLGATHYHFGSKEGLLGAVVHRRFAPINEERDRALDALLATHAKPRVREILDAFLAPLESAEVGATPRLMARLFGEPPAISRPLIEREFRATFDRFTDVLAEALPDVDDAEIRWRFHFAVGSMIHTLATASPLGTPPDPHFLGRLAAFTTAGIERADPSPPCDPQALDSQAPDSQMPPEPRS